MSSSYPSSAATIEPTAGPESGVGEAKKRVLDALKTAGPSTAAVVAQSLGVTTMAVRQHLQVLEDQGLVEARPQAPKGRGRPSVHWALTEKAQGQFPDSHAELTVGLLEAARRAFGDEGLERLVAERSEDQLRDYRARLAGAKSLGERVERLAARRSAEGYMAEAVADDGGGFTLVEHHCPICAAARRCSGLCAAELDVFRRTLGEGVEVERTRHLLGDDDRCAYRIRAQESSREE